MLDHHPGHAQVVLVSPCSGHGYKFCSVIGEIVADLATGDGTTRHEIGFLRLDRPRLADPLPVAAQQASHATMLPCGTGTKRRAAAAA